jgi:hypothetical protein
MKDELLLLFMFLLLGLILCSFLGKNEVIEGMENGDVFYGPNGASASIDGNVIVVTIGSETTSYTSTSSDTYTSSSGAIAYLDSEKKVIIIKDSNGNNIVTLSRSTGANVIGTTPNYDNYNHFDGSSYPTLFYGPDGGTARVIQTPNNNTIVITNKNGTTEIYYIDKNNTNMSTYYGENGGTAKIITDSNGKQAVEITTSNGSKIVYTGENVYTYSNQDNTINQYDPGINTGSGTDYNTAYNNTLIEGIPRSQIPSGDEDLYILKSQIVPPVCPKCSPVVKCSDNFDQSKCPPCKPCGRCSEPNFDCKKVPNYSAFNPDTMPIPMLSDFSGFGM